MQLYQRQTVLKLRGDESERGLWRVVADALQQPFGDGEFDLVWSMESGEHMPDKTRFVNELTRVCAPGGRVLVVTWCHRVLRDGEAALPADEQFLLDRICDAYYLPAWCSAGDGSSLPSPYLQLHFGFTSASLQLHFSST